MTLDSGRGSVVTEGHGNRRHDREYGDRRDIVTKGMQ